jgi:hypothetical protein
MEKHTGSIGYCDEQTSPCGWRNLKFLSTAFRRNGLLNLRRRPLRPDRPGGSRLRILHAGTILCDNGNQLSDTIRSHPPPPPRSTDPHLAEPSDPGRAAPDADRVPDRLDRKAADDLGHVQANSGFSRKAHLAITHEIEIAF